MTNRTIGAAAGGATALAACLGLLAAAGPALAGPCADDIARLERTIDNPTGKGAGTLANAVPGGAENKAPPANPEAGSVDKAPSLAEGGKTGGAGGTSEMNAASAQIATSAQDVRLQQAGQPTMAQGGDPRVVDEQLGKVRQAVDRARDLDAKDDAGCRTAVDEANQLMRKGS
jgi:hypothetical protein